MSEAYGTVEIGDVLERIAHDPGAVIACIAMMQASMRAGADWEAYWAADAWVARWAEREPSRELALLSAGLLDALYEGDAEGDGEESDDRSEEHNEADDDAEEDPYTSAFEYTHDRVTAAHLSVWGRAVFGDTNAVLSALREVLYVPEPDPVSVSACLHLLRETSDAFDAFVGTPFNDRPGAWSIHEVCTLAPGRVAPVERFAYDVRGGVFEMGLDMVRAHAESSADGAVLEAVLQLAEGGLPELAFLSSVWDALVERDADALATRLDHAIDRSHHVYRWPYASRDFGREDVTLRLDIEACQWAVRRFEDFDDTGGTERLAFYDTLDEAAERFCTACLLRLGWRLYERGPYTRVFFKPSVEAAEVQRALDAFMALPDDAIATLTSDAELVLESPPDATTETHIVLKRPSLPEWASARTLRAGSLREGWFALALGLAMSPWGKQLLG